MNQPPNRRQRRAAKAAGEAAFDAADFLKLADKFIDVANRENQATLASDIHMAFLCAAARYNAFVTKNVIAVDEHEKFVEEMSNNYKEMLRNHLADPSV
ncbi:DUF3144 domain-containing protein [Oricola sp.]|uniref:DUF3144 domain-containing protein n=1 Tax=Oricola sp. TaxID=1979950 RepID=UPI003BA94EBA